MASTSFSRLYQIHVLITSRVNTSPCSKNSWSFSRLFNASSSDPGAFGTGELYTTNFLSVLITNDGRLFVGAVTPAVLEADAASQGSR